jgi:hypothetical protein
VAERDRVGIAVQVDLPMKYLISPDGHNILDELDVLQGEARTLLELASLAARTKICWL